MNPRICPRTLGVLVLTLAVTATALVVPASPVAAASSLTLSRYNASGLDPITVQGSGFTAADTAVVTINLSASGHPIQVQASAPINAGGSFQATLTLPAGANQGTYRVLARDFHGIEASRPLTVLPFAFLVVGRKPNTSYVIAQHAFYVNLVGFGPNEAVHIQATIPLYGGNAIVLNRTVQTNAAGRFNEALMRVPANAKAGTEPLTATGQTTHRTATQHIQVLYRPFLLDPGTVRPGTAVLVRGREFIPASVVQVSMTVPRNGATNLTVSRNVTADSHGNFGTTLLLPSDVRVGKYTISALDTVGNFRSATSVVVSVHPTISVAPTALFPGEAFTVSGDNFASGVRVLVNATFPVVGGGSHTVGAGAQTGNKGDYVVHLLVPANAGPGQASVVARSGGVQAATHLQVLVRPTATAVPTSLPTATATATPRPPSKGKSFGFKYISVWYHVARIRTYNHVTVQGTLKKKQSIWVHVYFPSGRHLDYYTNTDPTGRWDASFGIPASAFSRYTTDALITFRLWHGSKSRRSFRTFTVIR